MIPEVYHGGGGGGPFYRRQMLLNCLFLISPLSLLSALVCVATTAVTTGSGRYITQKY